MLNSGINISTAVSTNRSLVAVTSVAARIVGGSTGVIIVVLSFSHQIASLLSLNPLPKIPYEPPPLPGLLT